MKKKTRPALASLVFLLIIAVLLVIDQSSKVWAREALAGLTSPLVGIPKILNFTYVENTGAAFGILEGAYWYFIVMATLVSLASLWFILGGHYHSKLQVFSLSLIVAGALGNIIDRIAYGFVTDFLSFAFMNFPVFNVADICITIGAALFVIAVLFLDSNEEKAA
ncbi:MAG: signal peptidase II [Coriobacteriia bacterium]|nr:signal peptidase II [Coriobacteriia bacterium]